MFCGLPAIAPPGFASQRQQSQNQQSQNQQARRVKTQRLRKSLAAALGKKPCLKLTDQPQK
jgi:hypothetical protein